MARLSSAYSTIGGLSPQKERRKVAVPLNSPPQSPKKLRKSPANERFI
jgi:hypothetical protein